MQDTRKRRTLHPSARTGNVYGNLGTNELCVDDVCVTRDQFKALVEGSILGANTPANADEEAADASVRGLGTPAAPPAAIDADTASSTPPADPEEPEPLEADATAQEEPTPELLEPPSAPAPELEAANDNSLSKVAPQPAPNSGRSG